MSAVSSLFLGIVVFVVAVGAYILPSLLAWTRHVPDTGSVVAINLLLGWTFIGWVVALAMALRSVPRPPARVMAHQSSYDHPSGDEP